jgi:hypothetical protein
MYMRKYCGDGKIVVEILMDLHVSASLNTEA